MTPPLAGGICSAPRPSPWRRGLKIPPTHLKWYAAFHNEGHHPHVPLDRLLHQGPARGFLTKQGMEKIRSALAQEIFRQDLISVYEQQTAHRDELRRASREKVAGLVEQINRGGCENPQVEQLLRELANRLSKVKGKKVYGYLRPGLKALVNQIVDELAKDERIVQLYDLWYQDKQAARNVYDEKPIERIPLCQNPDFKPIRNAVIQAAIMLPSEPLSLWRTTQNPKSKNHRLRNRLMFHQHFPKAEERERPSGQRNIGKPAWPCTATRCPLRICPWRFSSWGNWQTGTPWPPTTWACSC